MKLKHFLLVSISVFVLIAMSACATSPSAQSDNGEAYFGNMFSTEKIPIDDNVYTFKGKVIEDVASLTRQISPAYGGAYGNGYGYYRGETIDGKSFIRIVVSDVSPATSKEFYSDNGVIFKFTDTKATALLPGDVIEFKCRRQYEAIAPVRSGEPFDVDDFETWEFDFCRLTTGIITD